MILSREQVEQNLRFLGQEFVSTTEDFGEGPGGVWTTADGPEGLFAHDWYVHPDVGAMLAKGGWSIEWYDMATVFLWPRGQA